MAFLSGQAPNQGSQLSQSVPDCHSHSDCLKAGHLGLLRYIIPTYSDHVLTPGLGTHKAYQLQTPTGDSSWEAPGNLQDFHSPCVDWIGLYILDITAPIPHPLCSWHGKCREIWIWAWEEGRGWGRRIFITTIIIISHYPILNFDWQEIKIKQISPN